MRGMKKIALFLVLALSVTMLASCGGKTPGGSGNSGKVSVRIGYWPKQEDTENYALYQNYLEDMNAKYPDIEIVPDEYEYTVDSFLPTAASGQLPNLYRVPFTEVPKIVKAGYAADITDKFRELGYEGAIKPAVKDLVKVDGKYYGLPYSSYITGMLYNVDLFKEAGLTDENGRPIYPTNFEEMTNVAVQIKEKTGKAGFAFPTIDRQGGWMFMSMAWSFGVDFMEEIDGKWQATFDTPEMIEALQYISDMKWKHNVLPENILLSRNDIYQLFSTDQVACIYAAGDWVNGMISSYGLDRNNVSNSSVPAGKGGACSLVGGDIWMISPESTPEQIDAIFKWLEIRGDGLTLTEDNLNRRREKYQVDSNKGLAITNDEFTIYEQADRVEQLKEVRAPFLNVDETIWNTAYSDNLTLKPEEPVEVQQLYASLSTVLQEVLQNKNTDIPALVKNTNNNFQKDFLDKAN